MVIKELTCAGFRNDNSSVKKVAEVPAQVRKSQGIMDLPKVFGVLNKSFKDIAAACGITVEKFNNWAKKSI